MKSILWLPRRKNTISFIIFYFIIIINIKQSLIFVLFQNKIWYFILIVQWHWNVPFVTIVAPAITSSDVYMRSLTTNHILCTMHSILKGLNSSARRIYLALCYCISHSLFFLWNLLACSLCIRMCLSLSLEKLLSGLRLYFHDTPFLSRPGNEPAVLSRRKKIGFPRISREEFFNTRT